MPQFDRLGNDMSDDIAECLVMDQDAEDKKWGAPVVGGGMVDDMAADADPDYYYSADELTGYEEHERDSQCDMYERCPRHGEIISNGVFDGICGQCEGEADDHAEYCDWMEELVASGPTCTDNGFKPRRHGQTCRDFFPTVCYLSQAECVADNEIPF